MESLKELDLIFCQLIKMIPKRHYRQFEQAAPKDTKYTFNKKEQDQKNLLKKKSKRNRLDPNAPQEENTIKTAVKEENQINLNVSKVESEEEEEEFHTDVQSDSEGEEVFFSPRSGPEEKIALNQANLKDLLREKINSFEKKRKFNKDDKASKISKKDKKTSSKQSKVAAVKAMQKSNSSKETSKKVDNFEKEPNQAIPIEFAVKKTKKASKHHNPETALQLLEAKKEKLNNLPVEDKKRMLEREAWKKAKILSQGGEIKDDEARLKKAIKQKEKIKEKRSREWSNRIASQKTAQAERQAKRNENIEKRIQAIKDKKKGIKKSTSKGKSKSKGKK